MNEDGFRDCTALVTGASRGIGHAVAAALLQAGARVAITGRKFESLDAAARALDPTGDRVLPLVCHQGKADDISRLFDRLDAAWPCLDVAIVNAATNPLLSPLIDTDHAAWQKIIEVNLTGAFLTAQAAAIRMRRAGSGRIVFITSVAGIDPMPLLGAYSVSKAGVIGLTKALAKELAPRAVRVNAVAPGLIETRFSEALIANPSLHDRIVSQIPLGRHGQPEDVTGAVLYFASESSRYVTGQVLVVDGGMRV